MSICLLRIGDGRDAYHEECWASAQQMLPAFDQIVTVDDREHLLGFAGAIQKGWQDVLAGGCDYVMHLEMDFTFREPIPVLEMIELLEDQKHLVQIALKRQPVNAGEIEAGGIVEQCPDDFRQRVENGVIWTEHRRFWTTNPCVYSTALCRHGWPQGERSEGKFTHRLLEDPDARFAYWGGKFDAPLVDHIGHERAGGGY